MMNDLVSIIIPVYNAEKFLPRCLESVLQQTYQNLEVILIDDGSTDRSYELCEKYKQQDKRIKMIHKENGGVSSARNEGLTVATGNWIGFVDADDWIEADMIAHFYEAAQTSGCKIIVCGHTDYRSGVAKIKSTQKKRGFIKQRQAIYYLLSYSYFEGYLWNKFFSREAISEIRFEKDIYFCEDLLFCTKVFLQVEEIYYITYMLYHHCLSAESAMLNFNSSRLTELRAWRETENILNGFEDLSKIAKCRYADAAISLYYMETLQENRKALKRTLKKEALRHIWVYLFSPVSSVKMKGKSLGKLIVPKLGRLLASRRTR